MNLSDVRTQFRPGQRLRLEDFAELGSLHLMDNTGHSWWLSVEVTLGGTSLKWVEQNAPTIDAALDSVSKKLWAYIESL